MATIDKNWSFKKRRSKTIQVPIHPHLRFNAEADEGEQGTYMCLTFRDPSTETEEGDVKVLEIEMSLDEVKRIADSYTKATDPNGVWQKRQAALDLRNSDKPEFTQAQLEEKHIEDRLEDILG